MKKIFISVGILLLVNLSFAQQSADSQVLVDKVYAKMTKANDYSADATIRVDMPFIKMLPVKAKIYFKKKDKFKVDSKSIAILPKQNFTQLNKLMEDKNTYTALISGNETVQNTPTTIVNIIPKSDTSELVLMKMWIDPLQNLVLKSQITTRANGTVTTDYSYLSQVNFALPDNLVVTIDSKKFKIPKSIAADLHKKKEKKEEKEPKQGKIYIKMANYQVNKGVSDKVFD